MRYTINEIAFKMGISTTTVRQLLNSALIKIRDKLIEDGYWDYCGLSANQMKQAIDAGIPTRPKMTNDR